MATTAELTSSDLIDLLVVFGLSVRPEVLGREVHAELRQVEGRESNRLRRPEGRVGGETHLGLEDEGRGKVRGRRG